MSRYAKLKTFPGSVVFAVLFTLGSLGVVANAQEVNVSSGLTGQGEPLALRGYDPVSYFLDSGPQAGRADLSATHQGATYRFASKKNLRRFEDDPGKYLPQYGGFCAYGASVGAKFDGDPLVWKVVDGKLYLNLNSEIQKLWNEDIGGAVSKADANWPKIRGAAPESLKPKS